MKESYKDEFEQLLPIQILMDFFFFLLVKSFLHLQSLDFVCIAVSYFADITRLWCSFTYMEPAVSQSLMHPQYLSIYVVWNWKAYEVSHINSTIF